ncbi:MAG: adenylate/guanylate cyclase domain-containing protein [candidate division NC10 bacterium]|nr:adenylate/guanylate cyclase domain-containing protein [candidate division NC10 bacterium]
MSETGSPFLWSDGQTKSLRIVDSRLARAASVLRNDLGRLSRFGVVSLAAFVGGGMLGVAFGTTSLIRDMLVSGLHAWFLALPLIGLEHGINSRPIAARLVRRPFFLVFGFRCLAYTVVAIASTIAVSAVTGSSHVVLSHIHPGSVASLAFSLLVATAVNFVIMVNRLLGPRVLLNFVDGRYHTPKNETRFVLFVDLVGSTGLGEQLGSVGYHRLLNHFISDVSQAVVETEGEIHEVVGDQIVVTWPDTRGARRSQALVCALRAQEIIRGRQEEYRQEFGVLPRFRCALHFGPVSVGEVGSVKQQIVLVGNTMNTTARIEQKCRELEEWYLISRPALKAVGVPSKLQVRGLGRLALRGRRDPLEVFAISAAAEPARVGNA